MTVKGLLRLALLGMATVGGCATTEPARTEPQYNIVRPPEPETRTGGLPPDKEAEVQMFLQQRETSTRRCYQDVMNDKNDRKFQGIIQVIITIEPTGKATAVHVVKDTLGSPVVNKCLVETIEDFNFPEVPVTSDVQYQFKFAPAY